VYSTKLVTFDACLFMFCCIADDEWSYCCISYVCQLDDVDALFRYIVVLLAAARIVCGGVLYLIRSLSANSHTYYYLVSTHSLFHSRLKTRDALFG